MSEIRFSFGPEKMKVNQITKFKKIQNLSETNRKTMTKRFYYSSTVFDSCIYSIDGNIHEYSWMNFNVRLQHQLLQLEQLDFPVAHLENCKRISWWANLNSRWRHERSRWRHLGRNMRRWKENFFYIKLLWWFECCKWRWMPRTSLL